GEPLAVRQPQIDQQCVISFAPQTFEGATCAVRMSHFESPRSSVSQSDTSDLRISGVIIDEEHANQGFLHRLFPLAAALTVDLGGANGRKSATSSSSLTGLVSHASIPRPRSRLLSTGSLQPLSTTSGIVLVSALRCRQSMTSSPLPDDIPISVITTLGLCVIASHSPWTPEYAQS